MHHSNHFYGHAHLLARYCGLDETWPPRMHGFLQHGWNIGWGLGPRSRFVEGSPIFVWSQRTRRRAQSLGRRNMVVTGAPFSYLVAMEPQPGVPAGSPRRGTIFYPFHGWEQQEVQGDHQRLIDTITEVEQEPVTVCLYWQEHRDPRIRGRYEEAGFRVICHGYRGQRWHRTDIRFLYKQLAELRAHRRVASNRLSTAVWHGVLAGCEPAVYGDPMVLEDEDPTYGGQARIRRQWEAMHGATVPDLDAARRLAAEELGVDHLASPVELREIFNWPRPAEVVS